jgi:NAD(P)-dependent dehydrogenase (short-subunit alcohol dehydrogenase family)
LKPLPQLGDPTMLINNAGIVHGKKILDLTERDVNECVGRRPAIDLLFFHF